jgi:hypothetical protein
MTSGVVVGIFFLFVMLLILWTMVTIRETRIQKFIQTLNPTSSPTRAQAQVPTSVPTSTPTPIIACGQNNERRLKYENSYTNTVKYIDKQLKTKTDCDYRHITVNLSIFPDHHTPTPIPEDVAFDDVDETKVVNIPSIDLRLQWNPPLKNLLSVDLKIKTDDMEYTTKCKIWQHDYNDKQKVNAAIKSLLYVFLTTVHPLQQIFPQWKYVNYSHCAGVKLESSIHISSKSKTPLTQLCNSKHTCTKTGLGIVDFIHYTRLVINDMYNKYSEKELYTILNITNIPENPQYLFSDNK